MGVTLLSRDYTMVAPILGLDTAIGLYYRDGGWGQFNALHEFGTPKVHPAHVFTSQKAMLLDEYSFPVASF